MEKLNENVISCLKTDLKAKILPLLINKVFHVTSEKRYTKIRETGVIKNNKDKKFKYTYAQSENSYGRKRGYVCLVDLRNISNELIEEMLMRYYFLMPTDWPPVFLILNEQYYENIISWQVAAEEVSYKEMYVPHIECWYPEDIQISKISEILKISIIKSPVNENPQTLSEIIIANHEKNLKDEEIE